MTKRRTIATIAAVIAVGSMLAQSPASYKESYDAWVRNGAGLERDASIARERLAVRTDRAAAEAVKYENARKAFFEEQRAQVLKAADRIQPLSLALDVPSDTASADFFAAQDAVLVKSISGFTNDPDDGIQRLRRALDKERNALAAAKSAIEARQFSAGAVHSAEDSVERATDAAADATKAIADNFEQAAQVAGGLAEAWPGYYRALSNGARGIVLSDVSPPFAARPTGPATAAGGGTSTDSRPSPTPLSPTPPPPAPRSPLPASSPATARPTALPLGRYTGTWEFLKGVSTFTGLPPRAFDVVVKIENGQVSGTVSAAFDVLPKADPAVELTFSGPMQPGKEQSFPLETAEGATGTVTLIPASAFNLLEVRFKLENAPGKVSEAGAILIKKL